MDKENDTRIAIDSMFLSRLDCRIIAVSHLLAMHENTILSLLPKDKYAEARKVIEDYHDGVIKELRENDEKLLDYYDKRLGD